MRSQKFLEVSASPLRSKLSAFVESRVVVEEERISAC